MNLLTYWRALSAHDWDYAFSDDPGVYKRGQEKELELAGIGDTTPEHHTMWKGFWYYHRQPGACELPQRPKMLEWVSRRFKKKYYHRAEYTNDFGVISRFIIKRHRSNYILQLNGSEVKRDVWKKDGLEILKQHAEEML